MTGQELIDKIHELHAENLPVYVRGDYSDDHIRGIILDKEMDANGELIIALVLDGLISINYQ